MYLFYDTETSGIPDWKQPSESEHQPHLVELAAILFDADGNTLGSMDRMVRPDGWVISDENRGIHGISTEQAADEGIPESTVVAEFMALIERSRMHSAHVKSFDNRIMRIALKRFGGQYNATQEQRDAIADAFRARPSFCTANASTKLCLLPPTELMQEKTSFKYKTPDVAEAWDHFFPGQPFPGIRHRAMGDALAGKGVFLKLLGLGLVPDPDAPPAPRSSRSRAKPMAERADGGPAEIDLD